MHSPSRTSALFLLILILLNVATASSSSNPLSTNDNGGIINRELSAVGDNTRKCGDVIGTLNATDINSMGASLMRQLLKKNRSKEMKELEAKMATAFKYSIQTRKICATCEMFRHHEHGKRESDSYGDYCGSDSYGGLDAVFSGLLLLPVTDNGEVVQGSLKGAIWNRPTNIDNSHAPSEVWPATVPGDKKKKKSLSRQSRIELSRYELFGAMASAAAGFASLVPDGFGYGESHTLVYKSTYVKKPYQTSTIPLWMQARHLIGEETECLTSIENEVVVSGYDEGGYGAVAVAAALSKMGARILKNQPGGGAYQPSSAGVVQTLGNVMHKNYPTSRYHALALLGLSYSSINPNLANTDEGQNMLNHKYLLASNDKKNVIRWFSKDDNAYSKIKINSLVPAHASDMFNPIFIDFIKDALENNISNPCRRHSKTRYLEKLCEALLQNDLTNTIEHATYPIQFCHSQNDTVSSIANIPAFGNNKHLSMYDKLTMNDMHSMTESKCLWAAMSTFISEFQSEEILPGNQEICLESVITLEELVSSKWIDMSVFMIFVIVGVFIFLKPFITKEKLQHYETLDQSDSEEIEMGRDY
eukprot:CAMPEP_0172489214 /NCGR_PEP_ID=MMETSP1066-20121228/19069_1 /TAXON_ID=671091 /ORGANISM="Coscinodiscus wailesii, Strain CCMP2513" /LENGTH=587 /DNA_ID=CAMNT_0013256897 /DNA_START=233 /DNA_END=1996 /DNA_ORIENTATION=-